MHSLTYKRLVREDDPAVPQLKAIHCLPEIAQFLSISDTYFRYVTSSENVYFYLVYENDQLIGSIHLEKQSALLFMDILVFPEFQRQGLGTQIIQDIQADVFGPTWEKIVISIDESNAASLKLFENAGFVRTSKEDELINYAYQRYPV